MKCRKAKHDVIVTGFKVPDCAYPVYTVACICGWNYTVHMQEVYGEPDYYWHQYSTHWAVENEMSQEQHKGVRKNCYEYMVYCWQNEHIDHKENIYHDID